jgi:F-type H+-transporting ATPase subunit a
VIFTESELDHIGSHPTWHYGSLVFNSDTITATLISAAVVLILGFIVRAKVSTENPGKLQLTFEALAEWVNTTVEANLGKLNPFVVPLAFALFIFILVANLVHFLPTEHKLVAATADTNLTYAMAFFVIGGVHVFAIKTHGVKEYLLGYTRPNILLGILTFIEELVKPFTLALRLFGNIFAGGIMVALLGQLPFWAQVLPQTAWQLFDMAIGVIQAFIFSLLTILYFGMAASGHGGHDDAHPETAHDEAHEPEKAAVAA